MVEPQASLAKDETDESKKRRYETPEGRETDEGTKPCATEESERCLYSNLILILLIVSIACLGISIKYQWVQTCCSSKGFVSLGLLVINETFVDFETVETNIYDIVLSNHELKNFVVVLVTTVIVVISFVALFITSINIWFNSKGYLTGPAAVYILTLGASLFSLIALAAFLDLYVWSDGASIVPPKYLGVLFDRDPSVNEPVFVPSLKILEGFYIHLGGVCSSAIAFIVACRLASKLLQAGRPLRNGRDPLRSRTRLAVANRTFTEETEMDRLNPEKLEPETGLLNGRADGKLDDDSVDDLALFDNPEPHVTTLI